MKHIWTFPLLLLLLTASLPGVRSKKGKTDSGNSAGTQSSESSPVGSSSFSISPSYSYQYHTNDHGESDGTGKSRATFLDIPIHKGWRISRPNASSPNLSLPPSLRFRHLKKKKSSMEESFSNPRPSQFIFIRNPLHAVRERLLCLSRQTNPNREYFIPIPSKLIANKSFSFLKLIQKINVFYTYWDVLN